MTDSKRREYKEECSTYCDARFQEYGGKKRFDVIHPAYPTVTVAAPDETTALVTAAQYVGESWTRYSYYAYATVQKVVRATKEEEKR